MTTIVAAVDADTGRVHIAGDSLTNVYERPIPGGVRKLARVPFGDGSSGGAVLAASGDTALNQIITHDLVIPAGPPGPSEAELERWAHGVATECTRLAVAAGIVEDGKMEGAMLLCAAGTIWTIYHGAALRHPDGRAALGSGEGPAIGALDVILDQQFVSVEVAVQMACKAGIARDRHSGEPIEVATVEPLKVRVVTA